MKLSLFILLGVFLVLVPLGAYGQVECSMKTDCSDTASRRGWGENYDCSGEIPAESSQEGSPGSKSKGVCLQTSGNTSPAGYKNASQLIGLVETITNWIFAIFVLVAVIMVILAAFQFVTGGPDGAKTARGKLIWAAVGVAIALLAQGVVPVLENLLGLGL